MKRVTHRLRENKGLERPSLRVFVDTEARRERHADKSETQTLWFGWALFEREMHYRGKTRLSERWSRFSTSSEFWQFLSDVSQPKMAVYVYAHNWDYDAAMVELDTQAKINGWQISNYVRSTHFMWCKARKDNRTLLFVDTLNYFPMALSALGESMPVPKLPMPEQGASQAEWDEYCKRDVDVIRHAIDALIDVVTDNDLGNFAKTTASQAFNAFRHHYMTEPPLILADPEVEALERSAYHGGRVEVFNAAPRNEPVYYLDVNSMYPYVMKVNDFPFEKQRRGHSMPLDVLDTKLQFQMLVAECYLETDTPLYSKHIDTILCFPVGRFWSVLTTPEIIEARKRGHLLKVGTWVSYGHQPMFKGYVTDLYALRMKYREQGNKAFEMMVKLLLNSLYGKFGQRGRRWLPCRADFGHIETDFLFDCEENGRVLNHRYRFGELYHEVRDTEAFDSMPVIAAHVTAYARMLLWKLIEDAGRENVYYCDTDSLFVNSTGLVRLGHQIAPTELGYLKIEGVADYAYFRGPKYYQWGEVKHRKGIRSSALEIEPDVFEQAQFESYDRVLGAGRDGSITVKQIIKHVKGTYRKGRVLESGVVLPFTLRESEFPVRG